MKCAFCELPQIKEREIVGTDLVWAFPTNIPIVPGHTLISPRRCVAKYDDLTSQEKVDLEAIRLKITAALIVSFGAQGFNFAWNDGKVAGQSVPHFHLHVIPRTLGDTGVWGYEPRQFLYRSREREDTPELELLRIRDSIKASIV